ncbi:Sapep family Mn(2+)-dependent dipeptidase [Brenneria rubrifaciens]|uniref:Sapep family Mn(2+)-dependent dipeptidase n=1 Tax=Brenneria rubrifaciens TaxID=55213 RepID=A0A4P8QUE7_9GAMM|nr:Sapep family Mn(2+)-dependent dipeptidase [Brenneria rubrifaciens]QCR09109.1 Sapep family Mn(2+)-dependent dipeptidase [Brenneria rubrifaciens]
MSTSLTTLEKALLPKIECWLAAHRESMIDELAKWVEVPSVSRPDLAQPGAPFGPDCAKMLQVALSLAEQSGFRTEQHEGYAGSVIYGNHCEDIGLINHLDVVPAGENWSYPPFTLTRQDDFLIGRGVFDNKGSAIMNLYLLKLFRDLAIPLQHNLRLVYGMAEETDMADLIWFAKNGPVPRLSLVTDGSFPVNYAQKGQIAFRMNVADAGKLSAFSAGNAGNTIPATAQITLTGVEGDLNGDTLSGLGAGRVTFTRDERGLTLQAQGIAGHAAFPEGTLSAAVVLLDALLELNLLPEPERTLAKNLQQLFASPYGEGAGIGLEDVPSGKLTLNAGIWQSDTSGTLTITGDIRYPVTLNGQTIMTTLGDHLAQLAAGIELLPNWRDIPPFYLPEDDKARQVLQQAWHDVTGRSDPAYSMGGVTHSKVLPRAITFGPIFPPSETKIPDSPPAGNSLPHVANEMVHLPTLLAGMPIYVIALIRLDAELSAQQNG